MKPQGIEDIRQHLLVQLASNKPAYYYVDPELGERATSMMIGDIANACATLYVGYKLGEQIEDVGKAIVRTIEAIGDVARSISDIIDTLGAIIAQIKEALEIINRKIDEGHMRSHMNAMRARSILIQDCIYRLDKLPRDASDPLVITELNRLSNHRDDLFTSIIQYVHQENGRPSPAAFIGCAPAVAMWAQSYTLAERYKAISNRIPPWGTPTQDAISNMILGFFDDYIGENVRITTELDTIYIQASSNYVLEYDGSKGHFVRSAIPYKTTYPDSSQYHNLFARKPPPTMGLHSTGKVWSNNLEWVGIRNVGQNATFFADPKYVEAAKKWDDVSYPEYQRRMQFKRDTDQFSQYRGEAVKALAPQAGW